MTFTRPPGSIRTSLHQIVPPLALYEPRQTTTSLLSRLAKVACKRVQSMVFWMAGGCQLSGKLFIGSPPEAKMRKSPEVQFSVLAMTETW